MIFKVALCCLLLSVGVQSMDYTKLKKQLIFDVGKVNKIYKDHLGNRILVLGI